MNKQVICPNCGAENPHNDPITKTRRCFKCYQYFDVPAPQSAQEVWNKIDEWGHKKLGKNGMQKFNLVRFIEPVKTMPFEEAEYAIALIEAYADNRVQEALSTLTLQEECHQDELVMALGRIEQLESELEKERVCSSCTLCFSSENKKCEYCIKSTVAIINGSRKAESEET